VVEIDASKLPKRFSHKSRYSKWFDLEPNANYTIGVVYKATGKTIVSLGVKWKVEGQATGLVDREDHYCCWPEAKDWTLKTFTFTSDPEWTKTQIILKSYHGTTAAFKDLKLVEGWYSNR